MTESEQNRARRGRLFPERTLSPEELAKRKAERDVFRKHCLCIFERVRPELIEKYYGWYIAVEPDSGDYFIDEDIEVAHRRAIEKYPNARHCAFCLSEIGATGRI